MSKNNLDKTIETLGVLSRAELTALQTVIADLLEVGYLDPAGAKKRANGTAAKGSIERRMVTKTLSDGTVKQYGPYLYLKTWRDGHLTSKYLGKADDVKPPVTQAEPVIAWGDLGYSAQCTLASIVGKNRFRYSGTEPEVKQLLNLGFIVENSRKTEGGVTHVRYEGTDAGRNCHRSKAGE